jgi:hypothetical protein
LPSDAESAALNDECVRDSSDIGGFSLSHKFEFSFLNANLMAPPDQQLIFPRAARCCAPQQRCRSMQTQEKTMKKLITIVALAASLVASQAFAGYDPGPTTGSASNQAQHATGQY